MYSKKHAYLVIAHNEPDLFKRLLKLLDHPLNDIYVHIDARSDLRLFKTSLQYSHIYYLKHRLKTYWGHYSQIRTELLLFKTARKNGKYSYFHLISGSDLPLKSQEYIHDFFEKNKGLNAISFSPTSTSSEDIKFKSERYYFFCKHHKCTDWFSEKIGKRLFRYSLLIQSKIGIKRHHTVQIYKGSNWVSLTSDVVDYVLSNRLLIWKLFRFIWCADELFIQTLIMNSKFKNLLLTEGNLRTIDWNRGWPYVWGQNTSEDFYELSNSSNLFARKFSYMQFPELVHRIEKFITSIKH